MPRGAGLLVARNTDSVKLITVYQKKTLRCKRFLDIKLREVIDCLVGVVVSEIAEKEP